MDNTTLAVKDLILNEEDMMSLMAKKNTRQTAYSYQVVMQSGCDFAVRRNEKGRKRYSLLVILPSQQQYYIEEGKTRKRLTAALLKGFMKGLDRGTAIPLPGVSWVSCLFSEPVFCDTLFHFICARNTHIVPYDKKIDQIKKGMFYMTCNETLFGIDFGKKRYMNTIREVGFDFTPHEDIMIPNAPVDPFEYYNNPAFNDPEDPGYRFRLYRGYNPVGIGSDAFMLYDTKQFYPDTQIMMYYISPTLYRYMIEFMAKRRGMSIKAVLAEVISDPEQKESVLFQSFYSYALIEKAYGIDVAKKAIRMHYDSGVMDILPYDQMGILLYGVFIKARSIKDINTENHVLVDDDQGFPHLFDHLNVQYNMNPASFLKYLFEESVRQGYEHNMSLFLYQWGQLLFIQQLLELPKKVKYPSNLASMSVKMMSKAADYSDVIANKAWEKVADHAKSLEYEGDKYKIILPHSTADIIREADRQGNCLKTYGSRILRCETKVCFLRSTDPEHEDESLVTIEVTNDDRVIQVKGRYNTNPSVEIWQFVNEWVREKELMDDTGMNPYNNNAGLPVALPNFID